jgi:hypothetical protein
VEERMNLCDVTVEKVLGPPEETEYGWKVRVAVNSWGHQYTSEVHAATKEDLADVKEGYTYLA